MQVNLGCVLPYAYVTGRLIKVSGNLLSRYGKFLSSVVDGEGYRNASREIHVRHRNIQ